MAKPSSRNRLSLKWLELFQVCARNGSLSQTAKETGLSISTVSHHLRSLEDHLGVELFNHTRRPMVLTPKGHVFLRNIDVALQAIRKATAEASTGDLAEASYLRLGTIEDLDSDVTPDLAVFLSQKMPDCDFLYHTDSSHEIIEMLRDRELDLGIATTPPERMRDLQDQPLLRDPFVVVLPATTKASLTEIVSGSSDLPFLQFSSDLIIANQIAAQLRRVGVALPHKFECGSKPNPHGDGGRWRRLDDHNAIAVFARQTISSTAAHASLSGKAVLAHIVLDHDAGLLAVGVGDR